MSTATGFAPAPREAATAADPMAAARVELEAALDRVSAAYLALPAGVRDEIDFQDRELEGAIDAALLGSDPIRALAAIRAWETHWIARLAYRPLDRDDELLTQIVNREWDSPIPPRGRP